MDTDTSGPTIRQQPSQSEEVVANLPESALYPFTDILCCPHCRASLTVAAGGFYACSDPACVYSGGFPSMRGQPVLIDFERSAFDRETFMERAGNSVMRRDDLRQSFRSKLNNVLFGTNKMAEAFAGRMLEGLRSSATSRPRLLVIGGGAIGSGAKSLYSTEDVDVIGIDVYTSPMTKIVADGHFLPFKDSTFDGVWIQAVLEHVLDPWAIVAEIHRVLKTDGIVYSDTPFMQQVHEGAYDFTRFTLSGHRWLFRNFSHIAAGYSTGAGTAFIWSIRYLVRALTGSSRFGTLVSMFFFFFRFADGIGNLRAQTDGASGVYFFGRKAATAIGPKAIIEFYNNFSAIR
jgi:SAM-dependent methyltransferase